MRGSGSSKEESKEEEEEEETSSSISPQQVEQDKRSNWNSNIHPPQTTNQYIPTNTNGEDTKDFSKLARKA